MRITDKTMTRCQCFVIEKLHEAQFYPNPTTSTFLWLEEIVEGIAKILEEVKNATSSSSQKGS